MEEITWFLEEERYEDAFVILWMNLRDYIGGLPMSGEHIQSIDDYVTDFLSRVDGQSSNDDME